MWKAKSKIGVTGPGSYSGFLVIPIVTAIAAAAGTTEFPIVVAPNFTSDAGLGPGNVPDVKAFGQTGVYVVKGGFISTPSLVTANSLGTINIRRYDKTGTIVGTGDILSLLIAANLPAFGSTSLGSPVVTAVGGTGRLDILAEGDVLTLRYVQTGAGLAIPANSVIALDLV